MSNNELVPYREVTAPTWSMIQEMGVVSHKSRKFATSSDSEAAMKLLFCYENNLPYSAANTSIYCLNNKLAVMGDVIAAQIRRHPNYDYRVKTISNTGCTIEIKRRFEGKWQVEGEASFTLDDAKMAGLVGKDNYQHYPSDMFFNRALARAQRRFAPDVFTQSVYTREELGDNTIDGEWSQVNVETEPATAAKVTPVTVTLARDDEPEPVPTLAQLAEEYGPAQILTVCGSLPGNDDELREAAEMLSEASNNG